MFAVVMDPVATLLLPRILMGIEPTKSPSEIRTVIIYCTHRFHMFLLDLL